MRKSLTIEFATWELADRWNYYLDKILDSPDSDYVPILSKREKKIIEKKYDNLFPLDLYEAGVLEGKLSALNWVLGEDWDILQKKKGE